MEIGNIDSARLPARDEMSKGEFDAMMAVGLAQAKEGSLFRLMKRFPT